MYVCMSAVRRGYSEVLIKYTGNVWLHTKDSGAPRGRAELFTESQEAAHREEKHTPATHSMVGETLS